MWADVETHAGELCIQIRQRPIQVIHGCRLREDDIIATVAIPSLNMPGAEAHVATEIDEQQGDYDDQRSLHDSGNCRHGLTI